jgi:Ftsk gamma domain
VQQGVLKYWGRSNTHQHWFAIELWLGQKFFNLAFCSYLQYFNWATIPGRRFSNSPTSQSPIVIGNFRTERNRTNDNNIVGNFKTMVNEQDIYDWWRKLDITWKRIFKQTIDINHNPDIDELREILNIESIECSKAYIVSLEPLQYLKKLRKLNCSSTNIISLDKIRNLTLIDELDCSNTKIKILEPISNFSNLWILKCLKTPLDNLRGMENLNSLEYFYCSGSTIKDIEPLRYLPSLKLVDCSLTNIQSIEPLKHLADFEKSVIYHDTPAFEAELLYESNNFNYEAKDSFFVQAAEIVVQTQQGSASLLQRRLKLGYNRAGRIIDQLEAAGIIGQFDGSTAREVIIKDLLTLQTFLDSGKDTYSTIAYNWKVETKDTETNSNNSVIQNNNQPTENIIENNSVGSTEKPKDYKIYYQITSIVFIIGIIIVSYLFFKKYS